MKKIAAYLSLIFVVSLFCSAEHLKQYSSASGSRIAKYKVDTIIDKIIYQSHFNYNLKQPIFVAYKLYKGGGDCDRSKFRFINDTKIATANKKDYAYTIYDQGHLANAEDFAYDCKKDELTFRFYNCLPQTANLNRGVWKKWEEKVRKESQTDSLLVIAGGFFNSKTIGDNKVAVPKSCWKVVQSLSTKQLTHILLFTNTDSAVFKSVSISKIENELGYKLPIKQ